MGRCVRTSDGATHVDEQCHCKDDRKLCKITDPRIQRTKHHALIDIVVIALFGVICGCNSWGDLPKYGRAKRDWLRRYFRLTNGILSADMFARVFQRLDPDEFFLCMQEWLGTVLSNVRRLLMTGLGLIW